MLTITDAPMPPGLGVLDHIHVVTADDAPGAGRLTITCYGRAWTCYWGAMGNNSVAEFVMMKDRADYVVNCLTRGGRNVITSKAVQKREDEYLTRIVTAVQKAFTIQQPKATSVRIARLERVMHANALIKVISDHGRRFFWSESGQRLASIEMDARGKLWWIDDYRGSRVCMERFGRYEHNWRGFSHGGTLKQLAQAMRNYIKTGETISIGYIAASYWGYSDQAAADCKANAAALPIIH